MPKPPMETTLDDIQRIINYKFQDINLLFAALWEFDIDASITLSTTGPWEPLAQGTLRPDYLARIGQLAVNALSWQLFWVHRPFAEQVDRHEVVDFYKVHRAWGKDANLITVVNESGLSTYLARRNGFVGPRLSAIFGAVWLDAKRGLEQVKDVLRELKLMDENGFRPIPYEEKDWLEWLRTYSGDPKLW